MPVILLAPRKCGEETSSAWAQGGIAAAVGTDDNAELHIADTLKAGAGLCDSSAVQKVINDGAGVIARLAASGVPFDRKDSVYVLGLEAAHSRRRIVHASGDSTGAKVIESLVALARQAPSIELIENAIATDLVTDDEGIAGVTIRVDGKQRVLSARQVVLATGGAGALWQQTTNPLGSWGAGLALAARAGAVLGDLEFMQFHPTAINVGLDPMPLASEALRGEGAVLIDETGERFTDELQPRDIVTRAIWAHMTSRHKVFLDARKALGDRFPARFPSIYALCQASGIDPSRQPIPVSPAAHYYMGGVVTDEHGRTSVAGLWACGEVACTGLHGANRLASNSLLEAASFGQAVAEDIRVSEIRDQGSEIENPLSIPNPLSLTPVIRSTMSKYLGVLRHQAGIETAIRKLMPLAQQSDMALVGLMLAVFAEQRQESRGAHARTDYPNNSAAWVRHQRMTLADIMKYADAVCAVPTDSAVGA
jgi:L-aspartate oxidase